MLYRLFVVAMFMIALGFASKASAQELICTYQLDGKMLSFPEKAPQLTQSLGHDDLGYFISMDLLTFPRVWTLDSYDLSPQGDIYFTGTAINSLWDSWTLRPLSHGKLTSFYQSAHLFPHETLGLFKLDPKSCQVKLLLEDHGVQDGEVYRYRNMTNVVVSPNGEHLLFDAALHIDNRMERKLFVFELDTLNLTMLDFGGVAEYGADWTTSGIVFAQVPTFGKHRIAVIGVFADAPTFYEVKGTNPRWLPEGTVIFDTVKEGMTHENWSPESREIPYQYVGALGSLDVTTGKVDYSTEVVTGIFNTSWAQVMHYPHQQHLDAGWWWRCPSISIRVVTSEDNFSYIQGTNYSPEQQLACRAEAEKNNGFLTFDLGD